MYYVVTARQSRQADKETIHHGTGALTLMENAGVEAYNRIRKEIRKKDRILVLCGTGGNGGDGYVIARLLHDSGYRKVEVLPLGESVNPEAKINADLYKGKKVDSIKRRYDVYIDCLFGTGFSGVLPQKAWQVVEKVNALPGRKFSVDMPSGVDATTGQVHGMAFRCDLLLVVQYLKTGLFLNQAPEYFGRIQLLDISVDLAGKEGLPVFYRKEELRSTACSSEDYEILDKESLVRFQGLGERGYLHFGHHLKEMARLAKKILVVPGRGSWISDGKKVVIVPSSHEKDIQKGIALLSK